MAKSVFLEREGATIRNRVLDFLIVHQEFDYSLKDISRYSKVSYPAMKLLKKELLDNKWIVMTRTVGKAKMFKLNVNNKKVSKFIDFFWTVVNEEIEQRSRKSNRSESFAGQNALPVSARNM